MYKLVPRGSLPHTRVIFAFWPATLGRGWRKDKHVPELRQQAT